MPVAAASDGGGSIRIPASSCGVVGLKPSRGRVTWGPSIAEALAGWAVHFMVSRSVRDTAALLDALAGPVPGDPFVIAPPERPFALEVGAPVGRLRIGVATQPWSGHAADDEVTAATLRHGRPARPTSATTLEATDDLLDWEPFLTAMTDVWAADASHTIDAFAHHVGRPVDGSTVEGATLAAVEYGRSVTAARLLDGLDQANHVARRMGRYFTTYDVLLTPTLGRLPAPLGLYDPAAPMELHEVFSTWSPWESFLPAFNATGQPAISLPLHTSADGLPDRHAARRRVGVRVVAPAAGRPARGGPALGRPRPAAARLALTAAGVRRQRVPTRSTAATTLLS